MMTMISTRSPPPINMRSGAGHWGLLRHDGGAEQQRRSRARVDGDRVRRGQGAVSRGDVGGTGGYGGELAGAVTGHYRAIAVLGPRQCVGDREALGVLLGHRAGVVGYLRVGDGDCHGCSCSLDGNRTARRGSLGDDGIVQGELVRAAVQDPRELPCRVEYGFAAEVFVPAAPGVQVDSEAQALAACFIGWDQRMLPSVLSLTPSASAAVAAVAVPSPRDLGDEKQAADDQQPDHGLTVAAAELQERSDDEGDGRQNPHVDTSYSPGGAPSGGYARPAPQLVLGLGHF